MTMQEQFDEALRRLLREENGENRLQYLSGDGQELDWRLDLARYLLNRVQALSPGDPRREEWTGDFRYAMESVTRLMAKQRWA